MEKLRVERPDGRLLWYYAFDRPLPDVLDLPQPRRADDALEMRRNALLGEQVVISTGRQDRTFLPPPEACPLCPTPRSASCTTEIPSERYELVSFENRFPSLRGDAHEPARTGQPLFETAAARGASEVLVYSPQHDATLASLPVAQTRHLVDVWADRYRELGAREGIAYVFIFENRGREIGVTLTHPHGQIYALPFVPPRPAREFEQAAAYGVHSGTCLICDLVASEIEDGRRVFASAGDFVAYVPFAARLPYEVHIASAVHRPSLLDLTESEREALAEIVRTVQGKYDALWGFAMPYTMSMHQRATDGIERAGDHLHIEFAPPYRSRDRLKYLAGIETGAGTFVNDVAPEAAAAELRASGSA